MELGGGVKETAPLDKFAKKKMKMLNDIFEVIIYHFNRFFLTEI